MRFLAATAFICASAIASSAQAEPLKLSEQNIHDARCALVSAMIADEVKERGADPMAGIIYFFGKLRGSLPDTPFEEIFTPAFVLEVADNLDSYRKPCGQEMMTVGPEMVALGEKIQALGNEEQAPN